MLLVGDNIYISYKRRSTMGSDKKKRKLVEKEAIVEEELV